jgi:bile acid:Na+ symporter, BASS family
MPLLRLSRIFWILAALSGMTFALAALLGRAGEAGVFAITFFACLSVACGTHEKLRSVAYTMLILALVCLAMFFPRPFQSVGDFRLTLLIVPLLQIIMFSVGSQMSLNDFEGVIRMPKAVFIGLICQFSIMPLLGFSLAKSFPLTPEIAAGLILIGCSPSGLASNVMSFLAKANLALSVTLTACATLMAPIMTPFLMKVLAGQFVPIDFWQMMAGIIGIVIYPIMAGLMFNALAYGRAVRRTVLLQAISFTVVILMIQGGLGLIGGQAASWNAAAVFKIMLWVLVLPPVVGWGVGRLLHGRKDRLDRTMAFASMAGIGVILTIITAAGRDSLLTIGGWLLLACLLHNIGGYFLGYWSCRLLRMDERTCRTIALEVGQQNGGLASGIALQMGKVATLGLAPAVFGALMNVTGSALATWWRRVPVAGEGEDGVTVLVQPGLNSRSITSIKP